MENINLKKEYNSIRVNKSYDKHLKQSPKIKNN